MCFDGTTCGQMSQEKYFSHNFNNISKQIMEQDKIRWGRELGQATLHELLERLVKCSRNPIPNKYNTNENTNTNRIHVKIQIRQRYKYKYKLWETHVAAVVGKTRQVIREPTSTFLYLPHFLLNLLYTLYKLLSVNNDTNYSTKRTDWGRISSDHFLV